MFEHYEKALATIAKMLKERFSERIENIYVFGSRVRGDYSDDSDIDVLILVFNKTPDLEREIISLIVDAEETMNMSFTPVVKDSASFTRERENNSPFYKNIINEGTLL